MSRGGGRAASEVGGRGGMSRDGKRRSPRNAKKPAPKPKGASTSAANEKEARLKSSYSEVRYLPTSIINEKKKSMTSLIR